MELASRSHRFIAAFIDLCILFGIVVIFGAFGAFDKKSDTLENVAVAFFGITMITQLFLLSKYGQTIGKMITKIKIVRLEDMSNGGFYVNVLKRGLINFVAFTIIVPLIDYLSIFSESKRCLHDKIAGTIVINSSSLIITKIPSIDDNNLNKLERKALLFVVLFIIGGTFLFGSISLITTAIINFNLIKLADPSKLDPLQFKKIPDYLMYLLLAGRLLSYFLAGIYYSRFLQKIIYNKMLVIAGVAALFQYLFLLGAFQRPIKLILCITFFAIFIAGNLFTKIMPNKIVH